VLLFLERELNMAYISCEKELENYICEHQEDFISVLKRTIYDESYDIKFLGRQVKIGENNIADLVYYYDDINDTKEEVVFYKNFIIVELKFRETSPKDLAQISRYMSCLKEKFNSDKKYSNFFVDGIIVSFGEDREMQEIICNNAISEAIYFLTYETKVDFKSSGFWYKSEEYIENLVLDDRIENLYKEVCEDDKSNMP
jgi:antitoxin component YwqK of YwqJK toxin-antitoxin module